MITTSVQMWIAEHPIVAWVVAHPLWAIAVILLVLLSAWGLLGAIARFIQQAWLFILQAPLKLIYWLFGRTFKLFNQVNAFQFTQLDQPDTQKRLPEILDRLEILRKEQEILIQEMRSLLESKI